MDNSALAAMIMPVSPILANALGGPGAGLALSALGKAVVGDDQATVDVVAGAISNGGDATRLKIRTAEEQLLRGLAAAGTTLTEIAASDAAGRRDALVTLDYQAAQDRHDARERQTKTNDKTNSILAYLVTAGFFAVMFLLVFYPRVIGSNQVQPEIKASLQTMFGVLGTAWVGVMTYYFGSSIGSKRRLPYSRKTSCQNRALHLNSGGSCI